MPTKKSTRSFAHKQLKSKKKKPTAKPKKSTKRKSLKKRVLSVGNINEKLTKIYQDADGSMPDMRHISHVRKSRWHRFVVWTISALLVFSAAAWAGFFFFGTGGPVFSEENIVMTITAPEQVKSGEIITYRIRVSNKQPLQLAQTELTLNYPDGFAIEETSLLPLDDNQNKWRFGTLDPNEAVVLDVTGKLVGEIDTTQSLRAFFTYKPSNFNSDFQTVETLTHSFTETPLKLVTTFPDIVTAGDTLPLSMTISSDATEAIGPLEVSINGGPHFTFEDATTQDLPEGVTSRTPGIWSILSLQPGEEITLLQPGAFTTDAELTETIEATVALVRDGSVFPQLTQQHEVTLQEHQLTLSMRVNGALDDVIVSPEDILTFSLYFKNTGQDRITDISLTGVIDTPAQNGTAVLDVDTLEAGADPLIEEQRVNADTRRIILEWTKEQFKNITYLDPDEENTIPFTMRLADTEAIDYTGLSRFTITAIAEGTFDNGENENVTVQTQPVTIAISSETNLSVEATPIDPSTLEPKNSSNTYKVEYAIDNAFHTLTNAKIKTSLVGDVMFVGSDTSTGELTYDSKSKQIFWALDEIVDSATGWFIFTLDATSSGQQLLLTNTTLEATDEIIGKTILKTAPSIEL